MVWRTRKVSLLNRMHLARMLLCVVSMRSTRWQDCLVSRLVLSVVLSCSQACAARTASSETKQEKQSPITLPSTPPATWVCGWDGCWGRISATGGLGLVSAIVFGGHLVGRERVARLTAKLERETEIAFERLAQTRGRDRIRYYRASFTVSSAIVNPVPVVFQQHFAMAGSRLAEVGNSVFEQSLVLVQQMCLMTTFPQPPLCGRETRPKLEEISAERWFVERLLPKSAATIDDGSGKDYKGMVTFVYSMVLAKGGNLCSALEDRALRAYFDVRSENVPEQQALQIYENALRGLWDAAESLYGVNCRPSPPPMLAPPFPDDENSRGGSGGASMSGGGNTRR